MDWSQYSIEQIRTGTDESGTRLIVLFQADYRAAFGKDASCHNCPSFASSIQKLIKKQNHMTQVKNSGWVLKPMFNGIQTEVGGAPYSNKTLTDEQAVHLVVNHPHGENLFASFPQDWQETFAKEIEAAKKGDDGGDDFAKSVSKMQKPELVEKATELNLDNTGTVAELKARIIENGPEPKQPE